jgi:hypothetical protein
MHPLMADPRRVLCVSDPLSLRSDPYLEDPSYRGLFFCGEEVYAFLVGPASVERIADFLGESSSDPATVGMLTTLPSSVGELSDRHTLSKDALGEMASEARAIFVDAWDVVAFVVWEPGL